eukprot:TRINITY_DN7342_c0_g1_i3.p1 TRINITY_DN7342_c0_g1~~TRINITY_DN7342_c0_g1_i3.p1  ORF type:complete len:430 (-),score=94.81 TRINITY_DN7342_c0_g1_i3:332-1621(-)
MEKKHEGLEPGTLEAPPGLSSPQSDKMKSPYRSPFYPPYITPPNNSGTQPNPGMFLVTPPNIPIDLFSATSPILPMSPFTPSGYFGNDGKEKVAVLPKPDFDMPLDIFSAENINNYSHQKIEERLKSEITEPRHDKSPVHSQTRRQSGGNNHNSKNGNPDNRQRHNSRGKKKKYRRKSDITNTKVEEPTPGDTEPYLTRSINDLLSRKLKPSRNESEKREELLNRLQEIVECVFPDYHPKLKTYGSSQNGLALPGADMDLCLNLDLDTSEEENIDFVIEQLNDALAYENMEDILPLPRARCPIIKFKDNITKISCDICLNNRLAIRNTSLLRDYMCIDERTVKLGLIIKYWAKKRKINNTYNGTLSSYAYIIMLINFLQRREPPILPCLQTMQDENCYPVGEDMIDNFQCYYYTDMEKLKNLVKRIRNH